MRRLRLPLLALAALLACFLAGGWTGQGLLTEALAQDAKAGDARGEEAQARQAGNSEATVQDAAPAATETLSAAELAAVLSVLEPAQREPVLGDAARMQQFVDDELTTRSVLRAARDNKFDQLPAVQTLMRRAQDRVLLEVYLNQVTRQNLDPSFPSDQQIAEYYEANKERFNTPDRLHLWQIYLVVPADAEAAKVQEVGKKAAEIARRLKGGKADFARLAAESSDHQASRYNGGYMGLIRVDELLPEVAAAVDKLEENAVSDPIRTADGFHIVKRGARTPPQPVPLEDAREQIRRAVLEEGVNRVRAAALAKIREAYPVQASPADSAALLQAVRKELAGSAKPAP